MSRRFGRNQRRRAREALVAATSAQAAERSRADGLRQSRDALQLKVTLLERQLRACQAVLGESIALPPVWREVVASDYENFVAAGLMAPRLDHSPDPVIGDDLINIVADSFEALTLDAIECGIEGLDPKGLHTEPHAYIRTRGGRTAYAVRLDALAQIDRDEAVQRIVTLMASQFIDALRNGEWRRR